jgi:hypothetical protein
VKEPSNALLQQSLEDALQHPVRRREHGDTLSLTELGSNVLAARCG